MRATPSVCRVTLYYRARNCQACLDTHTWPRQNSLLLTLTFLSPELQVITQFDDDSIDLVLEACERMDAHLTAAVVSNAALFLQRILANTVNGTTYAGIRGRTTGAPCCRAVRRCCRLLQCRHRGCTCAGTPAWTMPLLSGNCLQEEKQCRRVHGLQHLSAMGREASALHPDSLLLGSPCKARAYICPRHRSAGTTVLWHPWSSNLFCATFSF
jgi:hypothetical protein